MEVNMNEKKTLTTDAGIPVGDNQNSLTAGPRGPLNDDYSQAGNLFRLLPPDEQQRLFRNIAASMQGVPPVIIDRQLEHFRKADPAYGEGVAKALGLSRGKGNKPQAAD
jgi:catalase